LKSHVSGNNAAFFIERNFPQLGDTVAYVIGCFNGFISNHRPDGLMRRIGPTAGKRDNHSMVEIAVCDGLLQIRVLGWSRLWSLKSRLAAPLRCVRTIRQDGQLPQRFWLRWPGTYLPGVIKAGSYWNGSQWSFWDVRRRRDNVVVIELCGWDYDYIVAEVENPAATITLVKSAVEGSGSP
jgi:hypothetical protein